MRKVKLLPILLSIVLVPQLVLAQESKIVPFLEDVLNFIFGTSGEEAFLASNIIWVKFGLWVIVFIMIFWALLRSGFVYNKFGAFVLAAIVAAIGIRFTPNDWVLTLATTFRFIALWIVAIIVAPYLIITAIIRRPGWTRRAILVIVYVAIFFGLTKLDYVEFGNELVDNALNYASTHSTLVSVIGAIVVIFLIVSWAKRTTKYMPTAERVERMKQTAEDRRFRESQRSEGRRARRAAAERRSGGLSSWFRKNR